MFDVAKCEPSRSPMMWVSRAGCGVSAKLSASQARQKRDRGGWSGNAELRRLTGNRNKKNPRENRGSLADQRLLQRLEPVVHVLVNLVLGEAVALLELAFELL